MSRPSRIAAAVAAAVLFCSAAPAETVSPSVGHAVVRLTADTPTRVECLNVTAPATLHVKVSVVNGAPAAVALVERCDANAAKAPLTADYVSRRSAVLNAEVRPGTYGLAVWNYGGESVVSVDVVTDAQPAAARLNEEVLPDELPVQRKGAASEIPTDRPMSVGRGSAYSARWHRAIVAPGATAVVRVLLDTGDVRVELESKGEIRDVTQQAIDGRLRLGPGESMLNVACSTSESATYEITMREQRIPHPPQPTENDPHIALDPDRDYTIPLAGSIRIRHLHIAEKAYVTVDATIYGAPARISLVDSESRTVGEATGDRHLILGRTLANGDIRLLAAALSDELCTVVFRVHVKKIDPTAGFTKRR